MGETSVVSLLVRMMVSLAIVLAIVGVAYLVAKRKAGGARVAIRPARGSRRRGTPTGVEVVGRVGLSRGTAAVAIRFGDRVVLVASSEQGGTTTLSEMPAEEWDELQTVREPIENPFGSPSGSPFGQPVIDRPTFVEALRQATARHA